MSGKKLSEVLPSYSTTLATLHKAERRAGRELLGPVDSVGTLLIGLASIITAQEGRIDAQHRQIGALIEVAHKLYELELLHD